MNFHCILISQRPEASTMTRTKEMKHNSLRGKNWASQLLKLRIWAPHGLGTRRIRRPWSKNLSEDWSMNQLGRRTARKGLRPSNQSPRNLCRICKPNPMTTNAICGCSSALLYFEWWRTSWRLKLVRTHHLNLSTSCEKVSWRAKIKRVRKVMN